uniref:Ig-like domain-containing protein n=1 Tax=Lates calcarifer TaxID=8187 RepID=A0A4W6D6U0_LATCA
MSTVSNTVTVTLQPNWPQIYRDETITVRCKIQGGGDTEWTYEWEKNSYNKPPSRNEYRINRATESDSGDYRCRGRKDYSLTQWSNVIRLTVSCKLDVFYQLSENCQTELYTEERRSLSDVRSREVETLSGSITS